MQIEAAGLSPPRQDRGRAFAKILEPLVRFTLVGIALSSRTSHLADDSSLTAFCVMRGRELESILIDLAVSDADLLRTSFASLVAEAATRTEGNVLFDIRVDGDPRVQRIAAIAFADAGVTFVLLANDGTHFTVVFPEEDLSDFTDPLSQWFALSLHERATTPFRGSAILLLGALRRCGYLDATA